MSKIEAVLKSEPITDNEERPCMLAGFVVVCSWLDEDGNKWFSTVSGNGNNMPLATWERLGLLEYGKNFKGERL